MDCWIILFCDGMFSPEGLLFPHLLHSWRCCLSHRCWVHLDKFSHTKQESKQCCCGPLWISLPTSSCCRCCQVLVEREMFVLGKWKSWVKAHLYVEHHQKTVVVICYHINEKRGTKKSARFKDINTHLVTCISQLHSCSAGLGEETLEVMICPDISCKRFITWLLAVFSLVLPGPELLFYSLAVIWTADFWAGQLKPK